MRTAGGQTSTTTFSYNSAGLLVGGLTLYSSDQASTTVAAALTTDASSGALQSATIRLDAGNGGSSATTQLGFGTGGTTSGITIDYSPTSLILTGGSGLAVTVDGAPATIRLGEGATLIDNTSGGNDSIGANSRVSVHGTGTVLSVGANTIGEVVGTNDIVNENGANVQFNLQNTGTGTIAVNMGSTGDYAGLLGGAYVVNGNVAGNSVNVTSNTSAVINGAGGYFGVLGTNVQVTAANQSAATADGATFNLNGTGNTVTLGNSVQAVLTGDGNTVVGGGVNDVVAFRGTNEAAYLSHATVNLVGDYGSVTVVGNNNGASGSGTGDVIAFRGDNNAAYLSQGTVNLDGSGKSLVVVGDLNGIGSSGDANVVAVVGDRNSAYLSRGTVNLVGSNKSLSITGDSNAIGSSGANNVIAAAGSGDSAYLSHSIVNLVGSNERLSVTGDFNNIGSSRVNNVIDLAGASATAYMSYGRVNLTQDGQNVAIIGDGNTADAGSHTGNVLDFIGTGAIAFLSDGTVNLDRDNASVTIIGDHDRANVDTHIGDVIGFSGTDETVSASQAMINLNQDGAKVTVIGDHDTATAGAHSGDTVSFIGSDDAASISNGSVSWNGGKGNSLGGTEDQVFLSDGASTDLTRSGSESIHADSGTSYKDYTSTGNLLERTIARSGASYVSYDDITFQNGDYERVTRFADGSSVAEAWNRSGSNEPWNKMTISITRDGYTASTKEIFANGSIRNTEYVQSSEQEFAYNDESKSWFSFSKVSTDYDRNGAAIGTTIWDGNGDYRQYRGDAVRVSSNGTSYSPLYTYEEAANSSHINAFSTEGRGTATLFGDTQIGAWWKDPASGFTDVSNNQQSGITSNSGGFGSTFKVGSGDASVWFAGFGGTNGFGLKGGFSFSF